MEHLIMILLSLIISLYDLYNSSKKEEMRNLKLYSIEQLKMKFIRTFVLSYGIAFALYIIFNALSYLFNYLLT